jgi:hypothetical protein
LNRKKPHENQTIGGLKKLEDYLTGRKLRGEFGEPKDAVFQGFCGSGWDRVPRWDAISARR